MKSLKKELLKILSYFFLLLAVYSANVGSSYLIYQNKLPDKVKKLRKF